MFTAPDLLPVLPDQISQLFTPGGQGEEVQIPPQCGNQGEREENDNGFLYASILCIHLFFFFSMSMYFIDM